MAKNKGYKQVKQANKQYLDILNQNTEDLLGSLDQTKNAFNQALGQYGAAGQQLVSTAQNTAQAQNYAKGTGGAVSGVLGAVNPGLSQLAAQQAQLQTGQEEFLLNALNAIKSGQIAGYGQNAQNIANAQQFRQPGVFEQIAPILGSAATAFAGGYGQGVGMKKSGG